MELPARVIAWVADVEPSRLPLESSGRRAPRRRRVADALASLPAEQGSRWLLICGVVGVMVFLLGPVSALAQERQPVLDEMFVFACVAAFVTLYVWAIPAELAGHAVVRPERSTVILALISVVIALAQPQIDWTLLFIFAGTAAGRIPSVRTALTAIAIIAVLASLTLFAADAPTIDALESGFEVVLAGLLVLAFSQLEQAVQELRRAQAQAARLAVADERLRIARDVHDLLGHSLSVIALKVELAGRLLERNPERAAEELRDVETVTRSSLRDVREAVAGYRRVTLDTELDGARMALSAAGVAVEIDQPAEILDPATDSLLGWVVREAVTNVVRHSGGTRCLIRISTPGREAWLEVLDDGRAREEGRLLGSERIGSGLSGIRERVDAIGGRMEAGPIASSGYRLAVFVPLPTGDDGRAYRADAAGAPDAGGPS